MTLSGVAYAKLNLALHVRGKLSDGRHRLETIFAFCEDGDLLSVEGADALTLELDGPFAALLPVNDNNLVLGAARALAGAARIEAGARILLTKNLPVASGIGGGSADAAAVLRLLTRLWQIDPTSAQDVAPGLGSDVPACLLSRSALGTEGGEHLQPVDLGLTGTPALLVNPLVALSTGLVFAGWDGTDRGPLADWRDGRNDLEHSARRVVPEITDVLEWLRGRPGTSIARMSGSGATCFALFDDDRFLKAAAAAVPSQWWHMATRLR